MQAYSYLLVHVPTGRKYYGVRKATTFDLMKKYFTSSKVVKALIASEPVSSFNYELRQSFDCYEKARAWEARVLRRIKAVTRADYLNQAISSPRICAKDSTSEISRRANISSSMKKVWESSDYRLSQKKPTEFYKELAAKRIYNSVSKRKYKSKCSDSFPLVTITKDTREKSIRRNQLSAYKKCGWHLYSTI